MWATGTKNGYSFWVKHYEGIGSEYGINGGAISKLTIRKVDEDTDLVNFDRGWERFPQDPEVQAVYDYLLEKYN